ncbi:hypothetical protein [Acrocarpospora sp. B8E8]|uniref:hypothetical protein n=1 Tax=Acrocarpospora sp. B8E8 TaxID=3153572 RepID=UPI00325D6F5A
MSTHEVRNALYDTIADRDEAFADMSRQEVGPGRSLFDGRVLHVLVQQDRPYRNRTVGLTIDEYRTNSGSDPEYTQIHYYQFDPETQTISLTSARPEPTAQVRAAHGYVTLRVDDLAGLTRFLSGGYHLSNLRVSEGIWGLGDQIWAGGWNWPDVPAVPLSMEDISVIQRGYVEAVRHEPEQPESAAQPGFSLDPVTSVTMADMKAILPDLPPEWAEVIQRGRQVNLGEDPAPSITPRDPLFPEESLPAKPPQPLEQVSPEAFEALFTVLKDVVDAAFSGHEPSLKKLSTRNHSHLLILVSPV